MSDTCRWVASDQARIIPNRHEDTCDGTCTGCLPCTEPHCRVCNRTHANGTCAECKAETRVLLHEIARMCDALPEEVEHRGIDGEAMMLLGPACDWEARGHLEASVTAGRVSEDYLADARDERHPVFVLDGWDSIWRDALDHDEPARNDLATFVDYLDRQLAYMADYPHVPFEDFAKALRQCASHLESVLHDGEQRDTGAPCMTCNVPLERVWGADEHGDGWKCPRCRQTSTEGQYRFAVQHLHREEATELTGREMEIRTGVKAGTVRVWATRGDVRRRRDSGRTLYMVADVLALSRGHKPIAQ